MILFLCFSFDLLQLTLPSLTSYFGSLRVRLLLRFCGSSDSCLCDVLKQSRTHRVKLVTERKVYRNVGVFVGINLIKEGSGEPVQVVHMMWFSQQNNQNEADRRDERRAESLSGLIRVPLWTGDKLDSVLMRKSQTGRVRQVELGKLWGELLSPLSVL